MIIDRNGFSGFDDLEGQGRSGQPFTGGTTDSF